jgi:glycosyltransferase involved in cell wall biosynthesis
MKELFLESMNTHKLNDQVTWTGKVPFSEVQSYYESHDAFFFTSLRDSSPAQLIEAMAYGLPVITLDLHGQGLMVNEERGFKASIDSPQKTIGELASFIKLLSNDRQLLQKLSKAAYTFALEQTWHQKVKRIVKAYYPQKT